MGSIATPQARILFLTAAKSDIEYRLMMLSAKMQMLSVQVGEISSQMYKNLQPYVAGVDDADQDAVLNDLHNSDAFQIPYDAQMASLNAMQNLLDLQRKQAEAQQKAISAELESEIKLLDKNLKDIGIGK